MVFYKKNEKKRTIYVPKKYHTPENIGNKIIQTDNKTEFTHVRETKLIHPRDQLCDKLIISYITYKKRKSKKGHRTDNENSILMMNQNIK